MMNGCNRFLTTLDTRLIKGREKKINKRKAALLVFSPLFFLVRFNVIAVMTHSTGARFTVVTTRSHGSLSSWCHLPLGMHAKQQHPGLDCLLEHLYTSIISSHTHINTHTPTHTQACRTLWSARVGPRDFLNRAEFLTWKLALNPICTGRHIFGQSCATADRENEPSILYNVASLLSYLPPTNLNLARKKILLLLKSLNFQTAEG